MKPPENILEMEKHLQSGKFDMGFYETTKEYPGAQNTIEKYVRNILYS